MSVDYGSDDPYSATSGLLELLLHVFENPDRGTGVYVTVARGKNLVGDNLPPVFIHNVIGKQLNLLGKYPLHNDVAPLILFACIFLVITILHFALFLINYSRGHYFMLNLIWAFTMMIRMLSFILRATWAVNIVNVKEGIAGEVFFVIPNVLLVSTNLILAQRLFTWRHPVGGTRRLFWVFMISLYLLAAIILAVAILSSAIPYLYYLSTERFFVYINLNRWASIMVIVYSLTATSLIGLSLWLPTKKDENRYTYQPWWIESFAPFYFIKKGAAQEAAETFMKRNSNHRHATRVIAATHHHFKVVKGLSNQRGDLKHNVSLVIIIISTVCLLIASILRAIVVFQARTNFKSGPAAEPVSMYFSWGVFEVIVNLVYIIGRADLRFYRPDRLPKKVRAIITAEQTAVVSSAESEEENDDDDDDEEEDYEEYADYEDGNQDEYASEFPDDELYFKNPTVGRESDSGLTPINNTNFEKNYSTDSYGYNTPNTFLQSPHVGKPKPYPDNDEFKF